MNSMTYSPVNIQASPHAVPSVPNWFGEATLIARHLQRQKVLATIEEQVRFARRRFGRYEVIDVVAVLLGYAISGERTLEAFYEGIQPWASVFMALFGRHRLPARDALALSRLAGSGRRRVPTNLVTESWAFSPSGKRGASRWALGSAREPLPRFRCGWDMPSSPPTREASDGGSACCPAAFAPLGCCRLHCMQAGDS